MKTILALADFTDASSQVLIHTRTLAAALGSQVILLHVAPFELPVAAYGVEIRALMLDPSPSTLKENQARLDEMTATLSQHGISVTARQGKGPVAETALAEISDLNADLVIMGSHRHNAFYNLFVGSTTMDMLRQATFPVLVVPCDGPEQEER